MKLKKLWHVFVFCFVVMLTSFGVELVYAILEILITGFDKKSGAASYLSIAITRLLNSIVGVLILKKMGKINILKSKNASFWSGVASGSVILSIGLFSAIFSVINVINLSGINWQPLNAILALIFMCITIGIYEEIIYRGVILSAAENYFGKKSADSVWKTVILSGILFGMFHFVNLSGTNFIPVLNQAIQTVGIGIFLGAVYMRCRNLYSVIFLHAIYDILVINKLFISDISLAELMSQTNNFVATFILFAVYIVASMFLLRKSKMKEIINNNSTN